MKKLPQGQNNQLQRADGGLSGFLRSFTMSRAQRISRMSRGIATYKPCHPSAFFDSAACLCNAVVSGGDALVRSEAICSQAVLAHENGLPVVVLHEGNRGLEQRMRAYFSGGPEFAEVSPRTRNFEPLYGLNTLELCNQILQSATKEYDLRVNLKHYIDGVAELLQRRGKDVSFWRLSTCPHGTIFDKVDEAQNRGVLTDAQAQGIRSKLMMGQSENYKMDTYLAALELEMSPIMYAQGTGAQPVNVLSAIGKKQVLCLDVMSSMNTQLMNVIIYQLKLAMMRGQRFLLAIEGIPVGANEKYQEFLRGGSGNIIKNVSAEDVFAMVGGDEKLFSALIGNSQIMMILGHSSGNSAKKWAEVIGQCDVLIESSSRSHGASQSSPYSLFMNYNSNSTVSTQKAREYIVNPEYITRMHPSEAYVMSAPRGELAHLLLQV